MNSKTNERLFRGEATSFYPDIIRAEKGHPTSECFIVEETGDERGKGMIGKVPFMKNERVAKLSGIIVGHTTLDTIQISQDLYFADRWFCRFLLHSCNPNLELNVKQLNVRALRNIDAGEYLTIDYANTDCEVAFQFACNCGAEKCRGWITGNAEELNDDGHAYFSQRNL